MLLLDYANVLVLAGSSRSCRAGSDEKAPPATPANVRHDEAGPPLQRMATGCASPTESVAASQAEDAPEKAAGDNSPSESAAESQSEDARANDSGMEEEPLPADKSKKVPCNKVKRYVRRRAVRRAAREARGISGQSPESSTRRSSDPTAKVSRRARRKARAERDATAAR
jgi:hypothetical protein